MIIQSNSRKLDRIINDGDETLKRGDFETASNYFNLAQKQAPESVIPRQRLGFLFYRTGKYDEAIVQYRSVLDIDPCDFRAHHGIGDSLLGKGEFETAAMAFRAAIEANPKYFRAHHNLGLTLRRQGDLVGALDEFKKSAQFNPNFSWSHLEIGVTCVMSGLFAEAEPAFRRAIELDPSWLHAYGRLARCLCVMGREDAAAAISHQACDKAGWPVTRSKDYCFTKEIWFANNILSLRKVLQPYVGKKVAALEIGSFQGMSTCWFLDEILTHQSSTLVCIDPEFQPEYRPNIEKSGSSHRVQMMQAKSQHALLEFSDNSLDFVYLDGWHVASQVFLDALLVWPLLKVNGIVIFDDYAKEDQTTFGQTVAVGVDWFCQLLSPETIATGRQLVVRKKSTQHPMHLWEILSDFLVLVANRADEPIGERIEELRKKMIACKDDYRQAATHFRDALECQMLFAWPKILATDVT